MEREELKNQTVINGADIWTEYGAFLTEEKTGGRENLKALLTPSKTKSHVGVSIRENEGTKYSERLEIRNEERDITLNFALFAESRSGWMERYRSFIAFLKEGDDGWLEMSFPELELTLRTFYVECTDYKPLTYLWREGVHASRFKIKFREPRPTF